MWRERGEEGRVGDRQTDRHRQTGRQTEKRQSARNTNKNRKSALKSPKYSAQSASSGERDRGGSQRPLPFIQFGELIQKRLQTILPKSHPNGMMT